jgi:hypothetical protein
MNVFELFAVLTLQKDDYNKGLDETEKKASGWGDKIKGVMQNKAVMAFALVGKAVVDVAKKLNQLMLETMNYADTVGDLAAQYGVSTDAISEMQYIADQSSTSVEQLTSSMSMLYMRAKQDGDAFKQLGISVKDNNGNFKAMDELFWETVGSLNDLEDEGAKSAYMLDLFGRSAMNVGEVLRKNTSDIKAMRQEAHDLGIVMSEETINFASDMNDTFAVLKLQGQSALASLVAGAPDAEEKLQNFFDNLLKMLDSYIPAFANFAVRLLVQVAIACVRIAPQLTYTLIDAVIETIFSVNWFQVGIDIGLAIVEGALNIAVKGLNKLFGWAGVKIPKVNLGSKDKINSYYENLESSEYEINENVKQDITVKVEASGDSTVSQETAEKTAEALAPYIDKILGGK